MEVPKKNKERPTIYMIQQLHYWVYIQKKWKQDLKEVSAPCAHCIIIHNGEGAEQPEWLSPDGWIK